MASPTAFTRRFGSVVQPDGVTFRVWAPLHDQVTLVLDDHDELTMVEEPDGYFMRHVPTAKAGQRYWFRLPHGLRPDPASRFQPEGPLGPSQVIDPHAFEWTDQNWSGAPEPHAHVLYELHLGTFSSERTWGGAEARLPKLVELGITTIEVMPIAEFTGCFGWGYDGANWFAPYHVYGTPDEARHFVDTAHSLGLAVILDVVYNHFGPVGNYFRDFSATVFGPPAEWGDSLNFDGAGSDQVRRFAIENAAYWIAEYHFDGLRFDATQAIADRSAQHIITEVARAARAAAGDRQIFLVGESETQDTRLLRDSGCFNDGLDALWCEDWHHAAYVALTGRREAYFTDYLGTANEFASLARFGTLYQGQWYSWQMRPRGRTTLGLPSRDFVNFLENHDQVANTGLGWRLATHVDPAKWRALSALLLLGPGLPLLFQGQEFGSTRPFVYFADHEGDLAEAVHQGRLLFLSQFPGLSTDDVARRLPRPSEAAAFARCTLDDNEREADRPTVRLYRDLIRLRRRDDVISRMGTQDVQIESAAPNSAVLLIRYISQLGHRLLVVNLQDDHVSPMNDALFAPPDGMQWSVCWSSEHASYDGSGVRPFVEAGRWLLHARSATLLTAMSAASEV